MEATAVVGLVGNITQFLQVAYELAVVSREVHGSFTGTARECDQLRILVQHIDESTKKTRTAIQNVYSQQQAAEVKSLQQLADECGRIAAELLHKLDKLTTRQKGWLRGIESVKIAGRVWWTKKESNELLTRLISLEGRLVSWWDRAETQRHTSLVFESLARLEREAASLQAKPTINHINELQDRINRQFASLRAERARERSELMLELSRNRDGALVERPPGSWEAQIHRHASILQNASQTVETYMKEVRESKRRLKVLESLTFRSMKSRHENIDSSHDETLGWIFDEAKTNFLQWLRTGTGIYWINGLAGSGKSTLMKFLSSHSHSRAALAEWAGTRRIIIASHFFWNSGTEMQKSQIGLFQTLLFSILRSDPNALDHLFPEARPKEPWDLEELLSTFNRLKDILNPTAKFCFFIDGLDEYDGDESKIIDVIKSLAASPNVKICTSSRPWPAFYAEWKVSIYSFAVQDFTRNDMMRYVDDTLSSHPRFASLCINDTRYERLVSAITERAQGIWLWVHLVVRNLLRDIRDNEPFERLKARLEGYPRELNKFFERIMLHIDPTYRIETSQIFLLALKAVAPMSIAVLPLLQKENGYDSSEKLDLRSDTETQLTNMYHLWNPRLQNRCGDLMNLVKDDTNTSWQIYQVDFLHRTVRDFLQDHYLNILRQMAPIDFDERVVLCKLLLLGIAAMLDNGIRWNTQHNVHDRKIKECISEFLLYVRELDRDSDSRVAGFLEDLETSGTNWISSLYNLKIKADILSITTAAGISRFTLDRVTANPSLLNRAENPLLCYALNPRVIHLGQPLIPTNLENPQLVISPELIERFLSLGANPNTLCLRIDGEWGRISLWNAFIQMFVRDWEKWDSESRSAAVHVTEVLLKHGAATRIRGDKGMVSVFELLGPHLEPSTIDNLKCYSYERWGIFSGLLKLLAGFVWVRWATYLLYVTAILSLLMRLAV